jgi:hypothetical protein
MWVYMVKKPPPWLRIIVPLEPCHAQISPLAAARMGAS